MSDLDPHQPHALGRVDLGALAASLDPSGDAAARVELRALAALRVAGIPLASGVLVAPAVEDRFYRLNNLPTRLGELFARVDFGDPDEDDLEELAPTARRLLRTSYLLDEFVDGFYEAMERLPATLEVRRPGHEGRRARRGRPALLALKGLWEDDWTFAALAARTHRGEAWMPVARPVLVHGVAHGADVGDASRDTGTVDLSRARRVLAEAGLGALEIGVAEDGVARVRARALDPAADAGAS